MTKKQRAAASNDRPFRIRDELWAAELAATSTVPGRGAIGEGVLDDELGAIGRERKMVREQLATAEKAIGAAATAQDRQRAAALTVARLRDALPLATPEQRRALLRELAHDGGVLVRDGAALLDLRVLRSAAAASDVPARGALARLLEGAVPPPRRAVRELGSEGPLVALVLESLTRTSCESAWFGASNNRNTIIR